MLPFTRWVSEGFYWYRNLVIIIVIVFLVNTRPYRPLPDPYLTGLVTHLHGDQDEVDQSADSTETNSTELQQS